MKKLVILGGGDLGRLIAHHAPDSGYEVVGFFDDFTSEKNIDGIQVLGKSIDIEDHFNKNQFTHLIIAIGYKHLDARASFFNKWKGKIPYANILHSSSYIDASVHLGEGIVILPGCKLDKGVIISDNVLLNTGVVIAHDTSIGFNTFLAPGVVIAGFVKIAESCFIGVGTVIIDNISIQDHVQTGGGSVVVKSIQKSGLYVGMPSRFVR